MSEKKEASLGAEDHHCKVMSLWSPVGQLVATPSTSCSWASGALANAMTMTQRSSERKDKE